MIFRSNRQKDDQLTGWLKIWCMLIFLFLSGFLLAQTRTVKVGISQNEPKMFIEPSGKPLQLKRIGNLNIMRVALMQSIIVWRKGIWI